jgi:hypothetical protein
MPLTDAAPRGTNRISGYHFATPEASGSEHRHHEATLLITAHHVLARACRWRTDQAADALLDAAMHHHIDVLTLARGLLELIGDIPRHTRDLHGPAAIAFERWGAHLVRSQQLSGDRTGTSSSGLVAQPHQQSGTRG